jgi:DoxX-like family
MENSLAVAPATDARHIGGVPISLKWVSFYWASTMYIVLTSVWAGVTDILHAPPLFDEVLRLGYPPHFSTLLGVWKVLGAVALAVPRYPLLKEWAYAGMFIDFSSAMVAYASVGDGVVSYIGPALSMTALITSWYPRPHSRRLAETYVRG